MAVLEDVHADPQLVAFEAFHGMAPALHGGADPGDDEAGQRTIEVVCEAASALHDAQRSPASQALLPPPAPR